MAARLQFQHRSIREITAAVSPEALRYQVNPGKWSVFENVAHLAAFQPVFIDRLARLEREASPAFDRYIAESDPHFPAYLEKSQDELLACIDNDRALIRSTLDSSGEVFLEKTGSHSMYGLLTVREWTEFFLLHEAHHLFTIFRLVQSLKERQSPL